MKFRFEEAELINNFFEDKKGLTKETVVSQLEDAESNTEDNELIEIAMNTIHKIKKLDDQAFENVFSNLPIDTHTEF